MRTHITAALVSLSIAISAAMPAPMAIAAPTARQESVSTVGPVIPAGDRRWRDGDRRRWDRHAHRHDRWRDGRRDRWHNRRYGDRHYGSRHHRRRDHDHDAAPYVLGGIALGAIILLNILEHENDRDRDRGYRR